MIRWLWVLFFLTLSAPFWNIGRPLIEVDDARFAEVPREMAVRGDWITPRLNDMDYVEKPPMAYWLQIASYRTFGVSEAAGRLPLALMSVLGMLGVAWLGSWLYSLETGLLAGIILGSSPLYFFLSHCLTLDLGLSVALFWTSAFILRALARPEDARWAGPAAWICAGFAFLSKGLVSIVFPGIWTTGLLLLFPRLRAGVKGLLNPIGPLLTIVIAAPWFIIMEQRHPGFLHFFFTEQHFQRFLTARYNRDNPWYFFIVLLPIVFLPWTFAAATSCKNAWAEARRGEPRGAALVLWTVLVTAFFSTSHSKLITYILPVFPHLSVLAATGFAQPMTRGPKIAARAFATVLFIAAAAACITPWAGLVPADLLPPTASCLAAAALAAVMGTALMFFTDKPLALGAAGLLVGALALGGLNAAQDQISAKTLSAAINARYQPGDLTYTYQTYVHGLPFYTGRRVDTIVHWVGELHYAKRNPSNADRFGNDDTVLGWARSNHRAFVVMPFREARAFIALIGIKHVARFSRYGPWALAELGR